MVAFLRNRLWSVPGKVLVVWDGGPNHKGPVVRVFLRRNTRVHRERLPPDAPALNPVELVWSWLKYAQLSNFVPRDTDHLDDQILDRLIRLKCNPTLLRALWDGSELPFPEPPNE
ncbi:Transposase OS=Ktedonobacter racemifer DSM 44963 GN=Krac_1655 PE=4 SV=1: DDE_3 [Gemmata massiliana]|uniref:Tc1-like transposase DDE domain-containing protein n=1 Tax=Gemmata massiliana TaxID=1210884 RepID=A0A6P2CWE5_9BACT|nr:transposase [Gemmata massiliana]VTR92475.1 Transposase OS=Ktedonobacter racemifer DSM 44963 GN=Krac_1655 PE=4 SV=1: DDE_3 [Gemmata massiliana]